MGSDIALVRDRQREDCRAKPTRFVHEGNSGGHLAQEHIRSNSGYTSLIRTGPELHGGRPSRPTAEKSV